MVIENLYFIPLDGILKLFLLFKALWVFPFIGQYL